MGPGVADVELVCLIMGPGVADVEMPRCPLCTPLGTLGHASPNTHKVPRLIRQSLASLGLASVR